MPLSSKKGLVAILKRIGGILWLENQRVLTKIVKCMSLPDRYTQAPEQAQATQTWTTGTRRKQKNKINYVATIADGLILDLSLATNTWAYITNLAKILLGVK